jgi:hypothetical protein
VADLDTLITVPEDELARILGALTYEERVTLSRMLDDRAENPCLRYADDPVGFVTNHLGETLWSKQKEILESVRDHKRTAVSSCHASGKSHIAARLVAWWVVVHPVGTARVVTTAASWRQVRTVLWYHIRKLWQRYDLMGEVYTTTWVAQNTLIADGFAPLEHNETAVQGIHSPHLLVVVDEAAGIGPNMGRAIEALMTGGHTRLLLIGNPSVDQEGSWFERACTSPIYNPIRIGAYDTPNFTGEDAGLCRACPANVEPHPVAEHLVDETWVRDVVSEFGEDSAFVEARVHARFPRVTANKVIPLSWCEEATDNEEPAEGQEIRLGVDIAADGGDEFVIAWADGWKVSVRHRSSGQDNANPVTVAGVILSSIRDAEEEHHRRGISAPVRVKVDSIGVGWGVAGLLVQWGTEGRHGAQIVLVNVAEKAGDSGKFSSQRGEMWWNGRTLVQPIASDTGPRQQIRLDVDQRTLAQLSGPTYKSDSSGRIVIESKKDMKRRGVPSPDRAEAVLLALYEPPRARKPKLVAPLGMSQANPWTM